MPGVQTVSTINNLGYQELKVLVNGSTDGFVGQVSYYLDGGLNMTGLRNSGNQVPNPDAISQFNLVRITTARSLAATLRRRQRRLPRAAPTISMARSLSSSATETSTRSASTAWVLRPNPYNQHRFGATLGGPIRHDKDFFFGSFGGFRYITRQPLRAACPARHKSW